MERNSKAGIVANEIEEPLRAQHKGRHGLAAVQRLALAVDDARLHQIDHAVRAHLGVNAQVALVVQTMENGLGDAADPGLQRGAVGNERGHVARHAHVHLGERLGAVLQQRPVALHNRGDMAHVHGGFAVRARHLPIHFGNHDPGAARGRQRAIHRGPQAHESVRIRRRNLHQHHVERQRAGLEEAFNLAEKDGCVIGAPVAHRLAHIVAQEKAAMAEMSFVLGPRVVRRCPASSCGRFRHCEARAPAPPARPQEQKECRSPTESIHGRPMVRLPAPARRSCACAGIPRSRSS